MFLRASVLSVTRRYPRLTLFFSYPKLLQGFLKYLHLFLDREKLYQTVSLPHSFILANTCLLCASNLWYQNKSGSYPILGELKIQKVRGRWKEIHVLYWRGKIMCSENSGEVGNYWAWRNVWIWICRKRKTWEAEVGKLYTWQDMV